MADNYTQSSTLIEVSEDKLEQARQIVDRIKNELENSDECLEYQTKIEKTGVWIYGNDSFDVDQAHNLVLALVDELNLSGIHICSWAHTCSKPRLDEFGGGAFAVKKGQDTVWVDAAMTALRLASSPNKNQV